VSAGEAREAGGDLTSLERRRLQGRVKLLGFASLLGLLMCFAGVFAFIAGLVGARVSTWGLARRGLKLSLAKWPGWCVWSCLGGLAFAMAGLGIARLCNGRMRRIVAQLRD
jgi:hypothetical protein